MGTVATATAIAELDGAMVPASPAQTTGHLQRMEVMGKTYITSFL